MQMMQGVKVCVCFSSGTGWTSVFGEGLLSVTTRCLNTEAPTCTHSKPFRDTHVHTELQVYPPPPPPYCISELHCVGLCHRFNFSHHLLAGGPASEAHIQPDRNKLHLSLHASPKDSRNMAEWTHPPGHPICILTSSLSRTWASGGGHVAPTVSPGLYRLYRSSRLPHRRMNKFTHINRFSAVKT